MPSRTSPPKRGVDKDTDEDEEDQAGVPAALEEVKVSSSAAHSADLNASVAAGESDVKHLQNKCRSTLFLVAAICSQEHVHSLMRVIYGCLQAFFTEDSHDAANVRSPEESVAYYLKEAKGHTECPEWTA